MVNYALPPILAVFPQETPHLLQAIARWSAERRFQEEARESKLSGGAMDTAAASELSEGQITKVTSDALRAFISVLKTARKMGLIDAQDLEGGEEAPSPVSEDKTTGRKQKSRVKVRLSLAGFSLPIPSLVRIALGHSDEELRADALDLICVGKKTTENPTYFEFDMMKYFIWINIKASTQALRQSAIPKIGKFLQRLKVHFPRHSHPLHINA